MAAAIDYIESLGIDDDRTRTSSGCWQLATAELAARARASTIIGTAPDKASVHLLHASTASIRTISAPSSTPRAWRCAPAITAPCRSWSFFGVPATARASFACYSARVGHRRAGRRAGKGARGVRLMDLKDLYRDVILDHNKTPAQFRPARAGRRVGRRPQPAVRRPPARHRAPRTAIGSSDLRFEGKGCAISVASASLMMRGGQGQATAPRSRTCSTRCTRCSRSTTRADARRSRQAGRAVGRARVPGAREMRQPLLAHAERRARAQRRSRSRPNEPITMRTHDNEPFVLQPRRQGGDGAGRHRDRAQVRASPASSPRRSAAASRCTWKATCSASPARTPTPSARKSVQAAASCRPMPPRTTCWQLAWEQLRTCYDPEIPINIVDLGLIYECTVSAQRGRHAHRAACSSR